MNPRTLMNSPTAAPPTVIQAAQALEKARNFSAKFSISRNGAVTISVQISKIGLLGEKKKKPGLFHRFSMSSVALSTNSDQRNKEIRENP